MRTYSQYGNFRYRGTVIPNGSPAHLALSSAWSGGPQPALTSARVIELGCGDGANLLPLAFYSPESEFIGVDSSASGTGRAREAITELELSNVRIVRADIRELDPTDFARVDFVIAHAICSWWKW